MVISSTNAHSSKGRKKRKRRRASYLESDKGLLAVFIGSAFIVSIWTIVVPWTLDSQADDLLTPADLQHHSVVTHLQKESTVTKQHLEKNSIDWKGSSTGRQKADAVVVSNTQVVDEKNNSVDGFFGTHSTPYHTIFSTGCSIFQDWQSYVFFYHAVRSGQEGHVTRIASGCNGEDQIKLQEMFDKEISSMRPGIHHLHQTPDYSRVPKKEYSRYKYFNKPFGVRHWMEHALGYPGNHELHDDSIIILMDPDQVMMRPFTNDFTNSSEIWKYEKTRKLKVEHGSPFAQQYGYAMQSFDRVNVSNIFQGNDFPTPISNMSRKELREYYFAMGPVSKTMWF